MTTHRPQGPDRDAPAPEPGPPALVVLDGTERDDQAVSRARAPRIRREEEERVRLVHEFFHPHPEDGPSPWAEPEDIAARRHAIETGPVHARLRELGVGHELRVVDLEATDITEEADDELSQRTLVLGLEAAVDEAVAVTRWTDLRNQASPSVPWDRREEDTSEEDEPWWHYGA
ncbi:MAG: hypothetical protein EP330_30335 [Deltaproteobacteria bacterium]|nr:MAG: hypothetical protein EP330_30335 [Deltaproteobacteria bacterium]